MARPGAATGLGKDGFDVADESDRPGLDAADLYRQRCFLSAGFDGDRAVAGLESADDAVGGNAERLRSGGPAGIAGQVDPAAVGAFANHQHTAGVAGVFEGNGGRFKADRLQRGNCPLYTSDAADE